MLADQPLSQPGKARTPAVPSERRTKRELLEQPGHPAVGKRLATGLAGRAVLQALRRESDLADRVAAAGTRLPGPPVNGQPLLLLGFELAGGEATRLLDRLLQRGDERLVERVDLLRRQICGRFER